MLLKLELPFVDNTVEGGSVVRWHKKVGESVGYGDPLFDIVVEEVSAIKRNTHAHRLIPKLRRGGKGSGTRVKRSQMLFHVRVTSSDVGVLRAVEKSQGDRIDVGEVAAILSTDPDEPMPATPTQPAPFRAVANLLEPEEA